MASPDLDLIVRDVGRFSIGLVGLDDLRQSQTSIAGSGTLVRAGNNHFVLTAHHVVEVLGRHQMIGMMAGFEHVEKNYFLTVPSDVLRYAHKERGTNSSEGPDLCAIPISADTAGTIKAGPKEFYSYDPESPEPDATCVTVLIGFPEAYASYAKCASLGHVAFLLKNGIRELTHGGWDYAEGSAYIGDGSPAPHSFGGVSGGGLWLVQVDEDGRPVARTLYGVAFYEDP